MANFLFIKLGLYCLYANHNIFIIGQGINSFIIIIFTNNLNVFNPHCSGITSHIKSKLTTAFELVDMGPLVRLKVNQDREKQTIKLSQLRYIEKWLDCYSILKAKTAKVFMQDTVVFPSNTPVSKIEKAKYIAKVGSIMYVMVETSGNYI